MLLLFQEPHEREQHPLHKQNSGTDFAHQPIQLISLTSLFSDFVEQRDNDLHLVNLKKRLPVYPQPDARVALLPGQIDEHIVVQLAERQ